MPGPSAQDIENYIRQNAGMPIQQASNQMADAAQNKMQQVGNGALAMKQAALQAISGGPQATPPPPPQAPPIPEVLPNDPSMSKADADNRMNAMIQAPATMQTVAAKLRAQADQDEAAEQHANSLQDEDMSGYTNVPTTVQREAAARQPAAQKFANLKAKIQPKPQDVRDTLHGAVEVTPDLEKKLGYGSDDEEDEK